MKKTILWRWRLRGSEHWDEAPDYGFMDSARDVAEAAAEGVTQTEDYEFPVTVEVQATLKEGDQEVRTRTYLYEVSEVRYLTSHRLKTKEG